MTSPRANLRKLFDAQRVALETKAPACPNCPAPTKVELLQWWWRPATWQCTACRHIWKHQPAA